MAIGLDDTTKGGRSRRHSPGGAALLRRHIARPQRVSRRRPDRLRDRHAPRLALSERMSRSKLELSAEVPDGVPDDVVRTVTETRRPSSPSAIRP